MKICVQRLSVDGEAGSKFTVEKVLVSVDDSRVSIANPAISFDSTLRLIGMRYLTCFWSCNKKQTNSLLILLLQCITFDMYSCMPYSTDAWILRADVEIRQYLSPSLTGNSELFVGPMKVIASFFISSEYYYVDFSSNGERFFSFNFLLFIAHVNLAEAIQFARTPLFLNNQMIFLREFFCSLLDLVICSLVVCISNWSVWIQTNV